MRWYTTSTWVVVMGWSLIASCGGDEDTGSESSGVKLDGSRLAGCFASADCKEGLVCYGANTNSMDATAGYCTDRCNADPEEDPFSPQNRCAPIDGQAATCSGQGQCRVDCTGKGEGDGKCPRGMECRDVDADEMRVAWRCAYPVGTARGNTKLWAECKPSRGDSDCAAPNVCVGFGNGQSARGFCSAPCTMDAECVAPGGVSARPLCAPSLEACSLDCVDGGSCPGGMECIDTSPGETVTMRCRFVPPDAMRGGEDMMTEDMPAEQGS